MAKSDRAGMPEDPQRSLLKLLRESGDALEAASPPFDAAAAASRLEEAARARGLLRPGGIPEGNLAVADAALEEEAPPFDVETGATRLREAADARGLLPGSGSEASGEVTSRSPERKREPVSSRGAEAEDTRSDTEARIEAEEGAQLPAKIAAVKDKEAVRRLYRKYSTELFQFGFHELGDQGLAEELVQETFIRFCQQARNYDASRGPVRTWLLTIAQSVAADIARRPSPQPAPPLEDFQLLPQYDSVNEPPTILAVDQDLDKLSSIYGDVLRLTRDGFTPSEIAGRLGIPIGTVKSRMAKATRMLQAELDSQPGSEATAQTPYRR